MPVTGNRQLISGNRSLLPSFVLRPLSFIFTLLLILSFTHTLYSATYYVNDTATLNDKYTSAIGNDANSGSASAPFLTIGKAMAVVHQGDTVYVDAGTYTEAVVIGTDAISLVGVDSQNTIINPPGSQSVNGIYANGLAGITIHDLRITDASYGIYFSNVDSSVIQNVMATNNSSGFFLYSYSNYNILSNNISSNNYYSFCLANSNNNTLSNNISSSNNYFGFYLSSSSSNIIKNSISVNNTQYGIYVISGSGNSFTYNDVWNNSYGNYYNASGGVGSISADPLFVNSTDSSAADYLHLSASSPCIDAGDPADSVPIGGGSRIDIGAYEYSTASLVASAGANQNVSIGSNVILNGSGSYFPDTSVQKIYNWTQVSGASVTLSNANDSIAYFPASLPGTYEFALSVSDGVDTGTDTVVITVTNTAPVANAGADTTVHIGDTIVLDGSNSSDADGDTLSYNWTQISGETVTFTGANTPSAAVATPLQEGNLTFVLAVSDGWDTGADTVTITVTSGYAGPIWYVNDSYTTGDKYTMATGNDNNSGDSVSPFRTITHALSVVSAYDTIYIDAGTYTEAVVIGTDAISLIGADSQSTIINPPGTGSGASNGISASQMSNIKIQNLLITDASYGIYFSSVDSSVIDNVQSNNNYRYGFLLYNGSDTNTLRNNTSTSNPIGFLLHSSGNNTLTNNIASSNKGDGFILNFSSNSNILISNTASSNNSHGFVLDDSSNNTLISNIANANNTFDNNGGGALGFSLSSSHNNTLSNNTASSNNGDGFCLSSSSNNTLNNNTASSNKWAGFDLVSSNNNTMKNSISVNNSEYGINLTGTGNSFTYNDVWNNSWGNYYNSSGGVGYTATLNSWTKMKISVKLLEEASKQ